MYRFHITHRPVMYTVYYNPPFFFCQLTIYKIHFSQVLNICLMQISYFFCVISLLLSRH